MPELPEVETVRQGLLPVLKNKIVHKVVIRRRDLRIPINTNFEQICATQKIVSLIRRGKYILGFTDKKDGFVLHLGMSGRIHIYTPQDSYTPEKHDHVTVYTEDGTRIVFNDPRRFGMLYLTHEDTWQTEQPFISMGPEPLSNSFSGDSLKERLKNRRINIKTALLDQKIVAGIGNIYACEALFQACIDPERAANSLSETEIDSLSRAIKDVLQRAIKSGGSTLRDYARTDGTLGYFQHQFSVYDRVGTSCPDCICDINETGGVQRIQQSGRSTFYCQTKQV